MILVCGVLSREFGFGLFDFYKGELRGVILRRVCGDLLYSYRN